MTRIPGISHGLDAAYRVFAKNRLKLTGRCTTESCAVPGADGA
jgi:predicted DCC family thiol-disulfide oxidoreductase YuxK